MIKSRGGKSNMWKGVSVLVLLLVGLFIVYMFLNKREHFQSGKTATVNYYFLPTCKYCMEFNPEWDKFVPEAEKKGIKVNKIDGSSGSVPENVKGFPHVDIVVNGTAHEFEGERTAANLLAQVQKYL
jgi:thiol-disulfide isomerase/thioredoxin